MHRTSHLMGLLLLSFLGVAQAACVEVDNEVVFAPSAGFVVGLATGCGGAEPPAGRLRGIVYPLPLETRQLPDFGALRPAGAICMDRLDVTERRSFPGLRRSEWFGVDFQGVFFVDEPGVFHFRLMSDDGSRLIVDGALVIDNDGYHAVRAAEGAVALDRGPHTIGVPFWQGPGPLALTLEVARPGEGYEIFHVDRPLAGRAPEPAPGPTP
jgi:hypothetical protein